MNILSLIHIHRLPTPSGVGRVMDQLITSHAGLYPGATHRMLVQSGLYDELHDRLSPFWQEMPAERYKASTSAQQARWIFLNSPAAESFWKDTDLVYCPAESYIPTRKAKLVCTIHDVAGFEKFLYPRTRSQQWHCLKWQIMFDRLARHADSVITVSEFSAARIAHFFPRLAPKLKVVYNAPHPVFGSLPDSAANQFIEGIDAGERYVLVPGGLSLRKNAPLIIEAWPRIAAAYPGVKLVVAGSCNADYKKQLDSCGSDRIVYTGFVSDEALNALYKQATIVWFPSLYEGFGMPVVEAMACGAPVVTSNAASLPEIVGDAALLGSPDAAGEHVDAIGSLLDSPDLCRSMREKGTQQAKRFSWKTSAETLEKIFQSA